MWVLSRMCSSISQCVSHLTPHPVPASPHNPHASLTSYPQCLSPHTPPNASPTSFLNQCFSHFISHQMPLSPHTPPNALITSYPTICLSPLIDLYLNPVCSYLKGIYKFHWAEQMLKGIQRAWWGSSFAQAGEAMQAWGPGVQPINSH